MNRPISRRVRAATALLLLVASDEARSQAADGAPVRRDTVTVEADHQESLQDRNKQLVRRFYRDVWFTEAADGFERFLADEFVIRNVGDREVRTTVSADLQNVLDLVRPPPGRSGGIDFQIAEGDLVATLWRWDVEPTSRLLRVLGGGHRVPIIHVLRIEEGKIVEVWNHRLATGAGGADSRLVIGLGIGLLISFVGWILFLAGRRRG